MFNVISDWGNCVSPEGVATLNCIPIVLQNVINALIVIAGIVAVFMVVFAGYKLVMSEGDPEKIANARRTLTYAIGGLIFIFLSFFFLNAISKFTGVEQLTPR